MNYRQWKKNYKKMHGINPPLAMDKRKQYKIAKRAIKTMQRIDFAEVADRVAKAIVSAAADCMRLLGDVFESAGTAFKNAAENIYDSTQQTIKECEGGAYGRNHD